MSIRQMIKSVIKGILVKENEIMNLNKKYSEFDIGTGTYGMPEIVKGRTSGNLVIGRYCSIAPKVTFVLVNDHRTDWVTTFPFSVRCKEASEVKGYPKIRGDLIVGNDVWLGYGATVLSGVKIGDGAVVAANAMVVKDVPPYGIVGGNPAKLIKYRFDKEIIDELLKIKWWEWPEVQIKESFNLLLHDDIRLFIKQYGAK